MDDYRWQEVTKAVECDTCTSHISYGVCSFTIHSRLYSSIGVEVRMDTTLFSGELYPTGTRRRLTVNTHV